MNVVDKGDGVYEISGTEFTQVFANNISITKIDLSKGSFTEIIEGCFDSCAALREFTLNSGIRKISSYSFYRCLSLEHINIPESVEYIGDYAFYRCQSLTINLENLNSLTYLGNCSFRSSKIISIRITSSLDMILGLTFSDCESLQSASFPDSIKFIGAGAFIRCSSLQSLSIQWENVQIIESEAFAICSNLIFPASFKVSMKIISQALFQGCTHLTSVILTDSVEKILDSSFSLTGITSIEIPSSVRYIGNNAFETEALLSIKHINIDSLPRGAYSGWQNIDKIESNVLHLINGETMQLSSTIRVIPDYAFYGTSLTSINLPNTLEYIGNNAFSRCDNLNTVTINSNIDLGSNVFDSISFEFNDNSNHENRIGILQYRNKEIRQFTIESNIESIGAYAFYYCIYLETIHMNEKVNTIPTGCFLGCDSLRIIDLSHINYFGCQCFELCRNLHINIDRSNLMRPHYSFGNGCFSSCVIDSIKLPNDFEYLSDNMFTYCTITNIVFPQNLKILGENSLYNTNIPDFELPDTVEDFKINSLHGMNITKFKIPPKVKVIPYDCFVDFPNLEIVELCNVNIIGTNAFLSCPKLRKVIIPPSCTIFGYSFVNCENLNELIFYPNASIIFYEEIEKPFESLQSLSTIVLHQDVIIPPHIFEGLYSLKFIFMNQTNILKVGSLIPSEVTIIFLGETDPTDIGTRFTVSSICSCVLTLDTYKSSSFCSLTPHLLSSGGCGNIPKVDIISNYNDSKHDRTLLIHSQFIEYICLMVEFIL